VKEEHPVRLRLDRISGMERPGTITAPVPDQSWIGTAGPARLPDLFLAAQKRRVGWALLTGNTLMSLVLIPEWRHAYENALRILQAAADPWLRDHAFTVMVVRVSEQRRQCFEDAGWRPAGDAPGGDACDGPVQPPADILVHAIKRAVGGSPADS
jgi:hypothetical protein